MEHPNTYTFKHSALPPIDGAVKGEIVEIDFSVSNLILKFQGHYRALSELRETLSDLLDSCDLNLQSIRIVPDGDGEEETPKTIGLTELSQREKELIVSNAMAVTLATEIIAGFFGCSLFEAARKVSEICQNRFQNTSTEETNKLVEDMARSVREHPEGGVFSSTITNPVSEN